METYIFFYVMKIKLKIVFSYEFQFFVTSCENQQYFVQFLNYMTMTL